VFAAARLVTWSLPITLLADAPDYRTIIATLSRLYLAAIVLLVLLAFAPSTAAYSSRSLTLNVYSDGYVHVEQSFLVDSKMTSVIVPLLSPIVSDLVATDQNGSPLSYGFAPGGSNVTIYTVGTSSMNLQYDTNALTSKNGSIWTLSFSPRFNSTIVLPQLSTLSSVSGTPYSITQSGTSPVLDVPPGSWKVSYGVPLKAVTSSTTTSGGGQGQLGGIGYLQLEEVGSVAVAVVVGVLAYRWWTRRIVGPKGAELRPDDVKVLDFIREKGGKVLEPEIRTRFALPKTSAWRQIKRLERLGYVKVTKVGSQNQIELLKGATPQT
jgi:uncharacterized membrane protein